MVLPSPPRHEQNYLVLSRNFVVRRASKPNPRKIKNQKKYLNPVYFNVGIYLIVPLLLGTFLGYQLDKWLYTKPMFTVIGICVGLIGLLYNFWKLTQE